MTRYRAPKGTYDVLPPDSGWWRNARRIFDDLAERYGYGTVLIPTFEDTDVFARGVGSDTEVVEKQMYSFEDKSGRSLTLRPEATAGIVRALIQSGGVRGRFKGAFWGEMFRYERPQKGRQRQFVQADVEFLGSGSAEADVEIIEFGYRFLEALDVQDVEVRLNSIGDPADRKRHAAALREYLEGRFDELSEDSKRRVESNPLRVLDSKADSGVVADAPVPTGFLGEAAKQHFEEVKAGLEALGIPYVVDERLVRGLDYYTRTVFEYIPTGYEAAQSSVGGGGRYDGLFELLGGKPTPAVGLAMGVDRILLASRSQGPRQSLDAFVVVADGELRQTARTITAELRSAGLRIDMSDIQRSVKAQFKQADRSRAAYAVVIGSEWSDDNVTVKDLDTGEQEVIAAKEIKGWLQAR